MNIKSETLTPNRVDVLPTGPTLEQPVENLAVAEVVTGVLTELNVRPDQLVRLVIFGKAEISASAKPEYLFVTGAGKKVIRTLIARLGQTEQGSTQLKAEAGSEWLAQELQAVLGEVLPSGTATHGLNQYIDKVLTLRADLNLEIEVGDDISTALTYFKTTFEQQADKLTVRSHKTNRLRLTSAGREFAQLAFSELKRINPDNYVQELTKLQAQSWAGSQASLLKQSLRLKLQHDQAEVKLPTSDQPQKADSWVNLSWADKQLLPTALEGKLPVEQIVAIDRQLVSEFRLQGAARLSRQISLLLKHRQVETGELVDFSKELAEFKAQLAAKNQALEKEAVAMIVAAMPETVKPLGELASPIDLSIFEVKEPANLVETDSAVIPEQDVFTPAEEIKPFESEDNPNQPSKLKRLFIQAKDAVRKIREKIFKPERAKKTQVMLNVASTLSGLAVATGLGMSVDAINPPAWVKFKENIGLGPRTAQAFTLSTEPATPTVVVTSEAVVANQEIVISTDPTLVPETQPASTVNPTVEPMVEPTIAAPSMVAEPELVMPEVDLVDGELVITETNSISPFAGGTSPEKIVVPTPNPEQGEIIRPFASREEQSGIRIPSGAVVTFNLDSIDHHNDECAGQKLCFKSEVVTIQDFEQQSNGAFTAPDLADQEETRNAAGIFHLDNGDVAMYFHNLERHPLILAARQALSIDFLDIAPGTTFSIDDSQYEVVQLDRMDQDYGLSYLPTHFAEVREPGENYIYMLSCHNGQTNVPRDVFIARRIGAVEPVKSKIAFFMGESQTQAEILNLEIEALQAQQAQLSREINQSRNRWTQTQLRMRLKRVNRDLTGLQRSALV